MSGLQAQYGNEGRLTHTASAVVCANIVQPIKIEKKQHLSFSTVIPGNTRGSLSFSANGSQAAEGGVVALEGNEPSRNAEFLISAYPGASFFLDIPEEVILSSGSESMKVDGFNSNFGETAVVNNQGIAYVSIGARLNVAAKQSAGNYTAHFKVTLAYN